MQQLRLWVLTLFVLGLFLPLSLVHSQQQGVKVSQPAPGQGSGEIVRRLEPVGGDLLQKAQEGGTVRVIVGLRLGVQPEGRLTQAAVQAQRRAIANAQTALLARLSGARAASAKRFAYIPFLALEVDAADLTRLRSAPEVVTIQEDKMLRTTLAESVPSVGAPAAWASGFTGAGQTVAVLDTGVDKNHPFLSGKVVSEACYSTSSSFTTSVCAEGISQSILPGSGVNCGAPGCEHGTHVAGIVAGKGNSFSGVARDASLIAIQVFSRINGCSSSSNCVAAFDSDVLLGLQRVQQLSGSFKIAAVNLSLGGGAYTTHCDDAETAYKTAMDNLRSLNIATVVASGNESHTGALSSPACISSAISVGSTGDGANSTAVNTVSSFSNGASFLSLLAPGELINSSVPGTTFAGFRGTSQATPHVAGAWAVLRSKTPAASVSQILQALTTTGTAVTDTRNGLTAARLRVDAAVNALASAACNYAISPGAQSFPLSGGNGTVNVTAGAGCTWTALSRVPWITLSGGGSTGNGLVNFSVAANQGVERTGTLLVAGQVFTVTQTGVANLAVDDGSFENALGLSAGGVRYAVNRLTPASYPATINRIAIFFPAGNGLSVGANVTLLSGRNLSGNATINGIALTTTAATVQALDQFNVYDIPPITIDSGDFVVGFQRTLAAREFPFVLDETPPTKQRSYLSSNGTSFTLVTDPSINVPGNFGIRAILAQGPLVIAAGSTVTVESCQPVNNVLDPNESVVATFSLRNVGTTDLTNVVATLQTTGGVTAPSGPQTYGALAAGSPAVSRSFTFTASGACGSRITATLNLQDGATNLGAATFSFTLGTPRTALTESFDGVTAPALPTDWTSTIGTGSPPHWVTSNANSDSAPNNAFATNPGTTSDVRLDSPSIAITSASAQLTFQHSFDTESGWDGGVLEIAIASTTFSDIVTAGGSFVTGGYTDTLRTSSNPIGGRLAWTGRSPGYVTTTVNLPASAAGKTIRLRWRMATDSSGSGVGWRIDGIRLTDGNTCATQCATSCLTQGVISPVAQTFGVAGGTGTVNLTLPQNCNWTAVSQASWLTIVSGASGSGSGAVSYSVAANTSADARSGTLLIAGRVFTVTQSGCGFVIAPASQSFDPAGGTGNVTVTAAGGCSWTAVSNVSWITLSTGASGQGSGTVAYTVSPNSGTAARTGTLTIAGRTFTVTQAACQYAIAPASQVLGTAGGTGSVAVTAQGGCSWTASSNAPWVTINTGASGTGPGTVNFTVAPLTGENARIGTLTIAGQTFTVNQVPYANDVGALNFDFPSALLIGRPVTIRMRVTNFGSSPQSNFPVSYQINNDFPVTETFSETLGPMQTAIKSFTALWTPFAPGNYQIIGRTHLSNDRNTGNDAAQTAIQVGQAQYRGTWQGTTSAGRTIRFVVDENDVVANLEVDISIPLGIGTCTGTFRNAESARINNGQFEVELIPPGGIFLADTVRTRGSFTSPTLATGRVDNFSISLIICGGFLGFGTSVTGPNWSVQRQAVCPTVSSLAPSSGMIGSQVVITGTNFTDVNAVRFANNVPASFVLNDTTRITAIVPPGAVTGPLTLSKPSCADVQTSAFTVLSSPAPTLTALSQNSLTAGGPAFTLTLTGTNFTPGSVVRWNNNNRPTAFTSNTQLQAAISASDVASGGTAAVTVFNPAPGGGSSNALNFTINPAVACPTVSNLNPASALAGTTVTITGANFTGLSAVKFANNASASFSLNSDTQITATVPSGAVTGPITLSKTGCPDVPAGVFTVLNPQPAIASLTPPAVTAGGVGFTLTVNGANFVNGALIRWNNQDRLTAFVSNTQLTTAIPATDIANDGTAVITVVNPAPGGGASNPVNFTINPNPRIVRVLPANAAAGGQIQVAVELAAQGNENALSFSLTFDPALLSNPQAALGSGANNGALTVNANQAAQGRLGLIVSQPPGQVWATGARQILAVTFTAAAVTTAASATVGFGDQPATRETVGSEANALAASYRSGTITITPNPGLTLSPVALSSGTIGRAYAQALTASGGTAPYSFAVSTGVLPPGLSLATNGALTGTPTQVGVFPFTVAVTDSSNRTGSSNYTLIINANLQFYPLAYPIRLLDTRPAETRPGPAFDTPEAKLRGVINNGTPRTQQARVAFGGLLIPSEAQAIVGTATAFNYPASGEYAGTGNVTFYPSAANKPEVSNLNYAANQTTGNAFTVGLSETGAFDIFVYSDVHLVIDVVGYYAPPGAVTVGNASGLYYHPLPQPVRLLETRSDPIYAGSACHMPGAQLTAGSVRTVAARGTCTLQGVSLNIPASALAIVGNLTAVNAAPGLGDAAIYSSDLVTKPVITSLNYNATQALATAFATRLGEDGGFKLAVSSTTDFLVDVVGYFSPEATDVNGAGLYYTQLAQPVRLLDTRPDFPACDAPRQPLLAGLAGVRLQPARLCNSASIIPESALALVGNATVVNFISAGTGNVTLYPGDVGKPEVSTLNYAANQVIPNAFTVGLSRSGAFNIFTFSRIDFLVDLTGYYAP